jgi:uncharacterized protein YegP (UPF0339 family)
MKKVKVYIKKSRNGQFYFTIHAANGKKLCHSETYTRKDSCREGFVVMRLGLNCHDLEVIDTTEKKK